MKHWPIILIVLFAASCIPHKEVLYMRDLDQQGGNISFADAPQSIILHGDLLEIHISSISQETNSYFFKPGSESDTKSGANTYQIATDGKVDLPLIGRVELAGKTTTEAEEYLRNLLTEYLQKPVVNVRLVNFTVTVLGEVNNPGVFQVPTASATIFEAIGLAGDMTIYGQRDNVLLIRNSGPEKTYSRLNLGNSAIMASGGFHIQNNDVIYVPPSKGRASADDNVYRLLPLIISGLTFVVVIISLTQ